MYFFHYNALGPPLNMTATMINNSFVQLSWITLSGGQTFFEYIVLIKDGNGAVNHNETVRSSQLIIHITDPCGYEATVIPMCQGIVPMKSIGRLQIPGGTCN